MTFVLGSISLQFFHVIFFFSKGKYRVLGENRKIYQEFKKYIS